MPKQAGALQGWILTSSSWMAVIGIAVIAPLLPFMQKDFVEYPNVDLLLTIVLVCPAIMIALVSPLVGVLVDAFGRKRPMMMALIVYAIAGSAPIWLTDLYAIIGSRIIVGISEATVTVIATVLTADYFSGRSRERWLALQVGSAAVVSVVAIALGGALGGQALGWRTPFLIYAATILLFPLIAAFLWEPSQKLEQIPSAIAARKPLQWRRVGPLLLMTTFFSVGFFVVPVQIGFLLNARGITTPEGIGLASAIANSGILIGSFVFPALARQPITRLLSAGMAILTIGFTIIVMFPDPQTTVIGSFIACVGGGLALPLLQAWIISRLPFEQRGRGMGGFMGAFFVGNFLSPILIGIAGAVAGGLVPAITVFSWVFGAAAVIAFILGLTRSGASLTLRSPEVQHGIGH